MCECCRLALGFDAASTPILLWRDILPGGIRDHSLARLAGSRPSPVRATFDDWRINACPHHGPSLAIAGDGAAHLAWFSGDGAAKGGVFYARAADGGSSFGKAIRLGDVDSASHPSVLTSDRRALVAWKESGGGGGGVRIRLARLAPGSDAFEAPTVVASTAHGSDHPLLVSRGDQAFLSWFTADEGYRLIPIPLPPVAQSQR